MLNKTIFGLVLLLASMFSVQIEACDASGLLTRELIATTSAWRHLNTAFTQSLHDEDGTLLDQSAGLLWLKRPNQMRYEIQSPIYALWLADGQTIWRYESDLEEVSKEVQSDNIEAGPYQILLNPKAAETLGKFQHAFSSDARPDCNTEAFLSNQSSWSVRYLPNQADVFQWVKLILKRHQNIWLPAELEFQDSFGAKTRLSFSAVKINKPFADSVFEWSLPKHSLHEK